MSAAVWGTDEAGRGPLAGPVVAAAAFLTREQIRVLLAEGMNDSKKLTEKRREAIFKTIGEIGVVWAAQAASSERIDRTDILRASLWAMQRSIEKLESRGHKPKLVIVDGSIKIPAYPQERQKAIPKADSIVPAVMAASVIAKVLRDRVMLALDEIYPAYGFAKHKGYPTKAHREAIDLLGPSPVHRSSFRSSKSARDDQRELGGGSIWQ